MSEAIRQGVSLNPDDFVAGGLIDDFDGVITTAKFDRYDFEGKSDVERPCLFIEGITKDGEPFNQHYSAGDIKRLVPSDDGEELIAVGESAAQVVKSTNMAQLLASLVNTGFPREKLAARKIGILKGLCAHFRRVAQPKRDNMPVREGSENKVSQVLVVEKILSLPWEPAAFTPAAPTTKVAGPGVSRSTAPSAPVATSVGATPVAAPAAPGELDAKVEGYVVQLLTESGGALSKAAIPGKIFQLCGKEPGAVTMLGMANNAEWLGNTSRPWKYDAASMTLSF